MKRIFFTFFALFVCAAAGCSSAQKPLSVENQLVQTCERLVNHYPIPRDSLDGEAYGKMFTEDGEFVLRGQVTKGRKSIVEQLLTRASSATTRHVTGSVNVSASSNDTGTGISYALVFSSPSEPTIHPKQLDGQSLLAVVSYLDKFKFENGECFFSQRKVVIDFLNSNDSHK